MKTTRTALVIVTLALASGCGAAPEDASPGDEEVAEITEGAAPSRPADPVGLGPIPWFLGDVVTQAAIAIMSPAISKPFAWPASFVAEAPRYTSLLAPTTTVVARAGEMPGGVEACYEAGALAPNCHLGVPTSMRLQIQDERRPFVFDPTRPEHFEYQLALDAKGNVGSAIDMTPGSPTWGEVIDELTIFAGFEIVDPRSQQFADNVTRRYARALVYDGLVVIDTAPIAVASSDKTWDGSLEITIDVLPPDHAKAGDGGAVVVGAQAVPAPVLVDKTFFLTSNFVPAMTMTASSLSMRAKLMCTTVACRL